MSVMTFRQNILCYFKCFTCLPAGRFSLEVRHRIWDNWVLERYAQPEKITKMEKYLEFAKNLAKEAEKIALRYFSFEVDSTWKEDNTPLTKADTEINDLVIKRINESYPEHSIYAEEKSDRKENSKYIWVCDPIDGTMAFSCGLPMFVFSIALVDPSNG